jgi:UTP-glucose-1-phosphate uridylyltransferase
MIGMYILPTSIFQIIDSIEMDPRLWELTLPDAMREVMKTQDLLAYITPHQRRDVGNPKDRLKACNELV